MSTASSIHLAIIPDGNRRWAKRQSLKPWKGHEQALANARDLVDWCHKSPDIGVLTFWAFSTENWNRSQEEINHLMQLLESYLLRERETFHKNQTRFLHSGRVDRIPPSLATLVAELQRETATYAAFTLHFALDYGGQDELVRAIKKIKDTSLLSADTFREHLDQPTLPDIDLVIRTSGEQRTSNFFLWQAAYAEWMFLPSFFPELTIEMLADCVEQFKRRERRFGT